MESGNMLYETYHKGNYEVIKINETLTLSSNIDELNDIVDKLLENNIVDIAIFLKDDSYLYSATGSVLVRCWEAIKDCNGNLALVNINQGIRDFLSVIDFDSVIKIFNSEEEL